MVERHAVAGATATIVADHMETPEAKLPHQQNLITGHGTEGIVAVIRQLRRLVAVAIAAQVSADHRVAACQHRRDMRPHGLGLREAVQQQERWAVAARDITDIDIAAALCSRPESVEHLFPLHARTSRDPSLVFAASATQSQEDYGIELYSVTVANF